MTGKVAAMASAGTGPQTHPPGKRSFPPKSAPKPELRHKAKPELRHKGRPKFYE